MTPAEYCQSKVALPGSSLYYGLWSLPTGQRQTLHTLGRALQLLQLLRNVLPAARRGRHYLPEDELRRFSIGQEALLVTRTTPALKELFQVNALSKSDKRL